MISPDFVIIGVLVQLFGGWNYLIDTLKGRVKPNKVSWLLWSVAPLVAFFAEIGQGVGILSLATFVVGFVPLIIFVASFVNKESEWKIRKFDLICGILSVLGLVLWFVTKVGNIAILFSIFADGLAGLPTMIKSYNNPETENYSVYLLGLPNSIIALLTINQWNFQSSAFPVYLLIEDTILSILIGFKLKKRLLRNA